MCGSKGRTLEEGMQGLYDKWGVYEGGELQELRAHWGRCLRCYNRVAWDTKRSAGARSFRTATWESINRVLERATHWYAQNSPRASMKESARETGNGDDGW